MIVIASIIGINLFKNEIERLGLPSSVQEFLYFTLFIVVGVFVGGWVWVSQKELDILFTWLDPRDPRYEVRSEFKEWFLILGLGVVLVGLVFSARSPVWFGVCFALYNCVAILAVLNLNANLKNAISLSRARLAQDKKNPDYEKGAQLYERGVNELERYWIGHSNVRRVSWALNFSLVGLVVALVGAAQRKPVLFSLSYATYILTIIISEWFIFRWRQERDRALDPLESELWNLQSARAKNIS